MSKGGLSSTAGVAGSTVTGSGGNAGNAAAFGGTSAMNHAGQSAGGQSIGGQSTGGAASAGSAGTGGTASAGSAGTGGKAGGGAGMGGAAAGGSAGTSGASGSATGGTTGGGGGGTSGAGGSTSGGNGGSGGTASTGSCAPAGTGWVVQYWTSTPPANMPAADLRIFNNAGGSVNFTSLELRHYFTNEETATLSFIFSTFGHNFPGPPYYEDEGGGNVLSSIVPLVPPVANASQYISIKFNATPGTFANGEYAQLGFYGNLSMYPLKSNQANDYTYINHPTTDPGSANKNTGWNHVTLYAGGKLVWGCEP